MKRKVFRGRDVADILDESSARESHSPRHGLQSRATNSSNEVSSFMQAQSRATTPSTGHSQRRSISINHGEVSSQPSIRRRLVDEPDIDEPTSDTIPSKNYSTLKKVRGTCLPNKLWGIEEIMNLEWNDLFHPIGVNAKKFAAQLGSFARDGNLLPLTKTSWDGFEKESLDYIWEDILDNTNAPNVLACRKYCMDSIHDKWRMWKHRVKKYYYLAYKTDDERKKNVPPNVQPADWEKLIKYFGLEAMKERAELNKKSRSNPVAVNRSGRKSHDCIRHELEREENQLIGYQFGRRVD